MKLFCFASESKAFRIAVPPTFTILNFCFQDNIALLQFIVIAAIWTYE